MNRNRIAFVTGALACLVSVSMAFAQGELELRVFDDSDLDNGVLVSRHAAGANITVDEADNYIIRQTSYGDGVQHGVGTITFDDDSGSGDFQIYIQRWFSSNTSVALTTCAGVRDWGNADFYTKFSACLAGDNDGAGGNGITGDVDCDYIGGIQCWGTLAEGTSITATNKISSVFFYAIEGGTTFEVLNEGDGDEINSIIAGLPRDYDGNDLGNGDNMIFGTSNNPVIVRPGSTGSVSNILSYTDMYLDYYGGQIGNIKTARSNDAPLGLTTWDAHFDELDSAVLRHIRVPYNSNPCDPDYQNATVTGTIRHRNADDDYAGEIHCNGTFAADLLLDSGLHTDGQMFFDDGTTGERILGSIIYHWVYGDSGETDPITYNGNVYLGCDDNADELPLEYSIVFDDKPTDMGYGTMGEVPFEMHDEGCFPENGYVWDSSEEGDDLDVLYLQFYGPIEKDGTGNLVTIKARHYPDLPSNPWIDVTSQYNSMIVEGDYPWEGSPVAPESMIRIMRIVAPSFPSGYEFLIEPNTSLLKCSNTKNDTAVSDFDYTIYTQE